MEHNGDVRTPVAWETQTYDGGLGLEIDGILHMGYDLEDLKKAWVEYLDRKIEEKLNPDFEVEIEMDFYKRR